MDTAIFLTIPYSLLNQVTGINKNKDWGINFLIDDPSFSIANIIDGSKKLKADFIFSISEELLIEPDVKSLFPKLYALFTVSAYAGSSQVDVPFFSVNRTKAYEDVLNQLVSFFKEQGEYLQIIQPVPTAQTRGKVLFLDPLQLGALGAAQLTSYEGENIEQVIFLPHSYAEKNSKIVWPLEVSAGNKPLYLLLNKVSLARKLALSKHREDLWQKRAQLYLSFLTLSKEIGQSEYYGVKEWYHKEYEVLPLWYKQFGHIIKVLSGKRSFKSLFNKN